MNIGDRHVRNGLLAGVLFLLASLFPAACGGSESKGPQGLTGWENGGKYDKLYDPKELDRVKGSFQEIIEITPLKGMAPGLGVIMRDRADDELVTVHLGPKAFVSKELQEFGLVPGQKIKVTGVWAEIGGKDVFMASKLKKGEFQQIKVRRTSDGMPFWSMSPEELAKERANAFTDQGDGA